MRGTANPRRQPGHGIPCRRHGPPGTARWPLRVSGAGGVRSRLLMVRKILFACSRACARIQQCSYARLNARAAPYNARPFPSLFSPYLPSSGSPAHLRACARLADKRRNRTGRPRRSTTRRCPEGLRPGTSLFRALPFGFCQSSASCVGCPCASPAVISPNWDKTTQY
jgi:hypothetical protein